MSIRHRLLGLAFASGDLLLELTPEGVVVLTLGAGPATDVTPESFRDQPLLDKLVQRDGLPPLQHLNDLAPGARTTVEILLAAGKGRARRATLSAFVLPDLAPNISCSIRYEAASFAVSETDDSLPAPDMIDAQTFVDRARDALALKSQSELAVAFVDVIGLTATGAKGQRATARIEAALQSASIDGASAARLSDDRYALLRDKQDTRDIAGEVSELARDEGLSLGISGFIAGLSSSPPVNALRALRFAIQTCIGDQAAGRPDEAFDAALARTLREAEQFRAMVRDRGFTLHYQPIVALDTGVVHHFEALARFGRNGPGQTIQMAEELALIEGFDLAVAEKAVQRLRQPGSGLMKIAINVSGASLAGDAYVQQLLRLTAAVPEVRNRLIVEVTESAALADIEAANRRLGALRSTGIKLCIDDFGAGAASFDYVHGLSVDAVKIDGKFVQGLENDPRARTLIAHLVEMCSSLELKTIAEFVETQACVDVLREIGVTYGQGWFFGKAEAEPRTTPASASSGRRRGTIETWS